MHRRPGRAPTTAVAAVLALAVLIGCGRDSTDDDGAGETTTTGRREAAEATTTTSDRDRTTTTTDGVESTSSTVDDLGGEGLGDLDALVPSLLITLDELAVEGFEDLGFTPNPGPDACGSDVDADHPAEVTVGTTLGMNELSVTETIRVYPTAQAAAAAQLAFVNSLSCDVHPPDVTVSEVTDVNPRVGADEAAAITATGPDIEATLVVARVGDAVVSFTFAGTPGAAAAAGAPDPIDVAAFGVGKILAALERG